MSNIVIKRIVAFYIDAFICAILAMIIWLVFNNNHFMFSNSFFQTPGFYQLGVMFFYFLLMEYYFKETFGKRIFKLKVVFKREVHYRFLNALIRTVSRFIPFEPFSIFMNTDQIMWHDKFSDTEVLPNPDLRSL